MSSSIVPNTPPAVQPSPAPHAAIYARVSSEDQVQNYSLPTQVAACRKLAQEDGYTVTDKHIFLDEGVSGTTLDRPALTQLRELLATGTIAVLIILDLDRLARKMGKLLVLLDELDAVQVRLLCVAHPVGSGPESVLLLQMRGAFAEYEREKILERTRRGRQARVKAGYYGGGNPPYGYCYIAEPHKGRVEIAEAEAQIVRWLFQAYLEGQHLRQLSWDLDARGVQTPMVQRGRQDRGRWNVGVIARMLKNTSYIGQGFWNKCQQLTRNQARARDKAEWIPLPMPALIAPELFDAVQQKLQRNLALAPRNIKHPYLLRAGRLRCGRCGRAMTGYMSCGHRRYRCYSQLQHAPGEPFCHGSARADMLEPLVWREVERALRDPQIIAQELARRTQAMHAGHADAHRELQAIDKALKALDREAERWDTAYAQEVIDVPELRAKKHDIAERRQRLLDQYAEIQAELQQATEDTETIRDLFTYCQQVQARLTTLDLSQHLALEAFDIRVTWTPDAPVQIDGCVSLVYTASPAPRCG